MHTIIISLLVDKINRYIHTEVCLAQYTILTQTQQVSTSAAVWATDILYIIIADSFRSILQLSYLLLILG